ncbi:MAG: hypothetical protein QNJ47_17805 [Nostocaceae cyanobacterium]|nr:hypothetical protein [Nostocaceae cyanobacterium]
MAKKTNSSLEIHDLSVWEKLSNTQADTIEGRFNFDETFDYIDIIIGPYIDMDKIEALITVSVLEDKAMTTADVGEYAFSFTTVSATSWG